jgi:hypothetical protein
MSAMTASSPKRLQAARSTLCPLRGNGARQLHVGRDVDAAPGAVTCRRQ